MMCVQCPFLQFPLHWSPRPHDRTTLLTLSRLSLATDQHCLLFTMATGPVGFLERSCPLLASRSPALWQVQRRWNLARGQWSVEVLLVAMAKW